MNHPGLAAGPIYLDYNATTPVDPRVVEAMRPWLMTEFGNPSSGHHYGDAPKAALQKAAEQVASLLGARPGEMLFTGSGSEADNLAITGTVLSGDPGTAHVITQQTEHPAVLETCSALQRLFGTRITRLPVDANGLVDPADLTVALTDQTVLVSIMHANNETGTIQPIAELARITHRHGAVFHTDAAQTVGKIPVDVDELGIDLLTVAGHKLYAPKGIGALYVRTGTRLEPAIHGGGQQHGLRAGTENVAFTVAMGAAAELAAGSLAAGEPERQRHLTDQLLDLINSALPDRVLLNGHPTRRLPNTVNVSVLGTSGHELLAAAPGIAASTGSACHSADTTGSPVIAAMTQQLASAAGGLDRVRGSIRLSTGRWTTDHDVQQAAAALAAATLWKVTSL
jgi:cysteine desulfurase